MRKLLFVASLLFVLLSCGKGESPEIKTEKVDVELADIESYFAFDKAKTVKEALALIQNTGFEKTVNHKKVTVRSVNVISSDVQQGTIRLSVSGFVDGMTFAKEFTIIGFTKPAVNTLTDDEIGLRGYGEWKVSKDIYLKDFDFDKWYINHNVAFFTVSYLKQFVSFHASSTDGTRRRELTDEELKKLSITDFKFKEDNVLTFRTMYGTMKSIVESRLEFNKNDFYALKVKLNEAFGKDLYMRGVYENLDYYVQGFLDYDRNAYAAELEQDKMHNDKENTISLNLKIQTLTGESLASIHKTLKGFKSLSSLKSELMIVSSADLETYLKGKNLVGKNDQARTDFLKATIQAWTQKLQFHILKGDKIYPLTWNDTNTALLGGREVKDVYLEYPRFEIVSTNFSGPNLIIQLKLASVNGEALVDIVFDVTAHNVK